MTSTVRLAESLPLVEAATDTHNGKFRARVIEADVWGSSGYYGREVLEAAASDRVFAAGTQIYLDHPGIEERFDRPERSVRDLAGKLTSDAVLESDGLWADIEVYPDFADLIESRKDDIGMSIRATAEAEQGEAAGRRGQIITRFHEAISVDFVTKAGAGGKVVSLRESARINAEAIVRGVNEATVNDQREALADLLRSAYGAEKTYVWLRDFDETTCWFDVETADESKTWQQLFTSGDNDLPNALTGDRIEVRPVTKYVPVSPAGQPNTQESKEDTMATTQIEESALADLREKAGRVLTLESERDTAVRERDAALADLAEARETVAETKRVERMDAIIAEAEVEFTALEADGLRAKAVIKDGALDEAAFTATVAEAAAVIAEANGAGRPRGNGRRDTTTSEVSEADLDQLDAEIFGETKEG